MTAHIDAVRERWPDAQGFYAERDHRTRLEVAQLDSYVQRPVEIRICPSAATDATAQRIMIMAANLTARWARGVRVEVPEVPLNDALRSHGDVLLAARIAREMTSADPFGNFEVQERLVPDPAALRLTIGPTQDWPSPTSDEDYRVDATGWTALGSRGNRNASYARRPATVAAASLAAAIGVADLFKRAVGHSSSEWLGDLAWCTWHQAFRRVDDDECASHEARDRLDLGNVLLAGVGAVGSAVAYILAMMPIAGCMTILDRDHVETSNLNRSPLFMAIDAALGRSKVDVVRAFLERTGVTVDGLHGHWRDHEDALSTRSLDVWVSLTNEDGAWAGLPFLLPPIVLHGTTTSGWGASCGRHIPRLEDCTACRMPRPVAEFRGPCAEGDIAPVAQTTPVRAALPFLSAAAAALVVAELSKLGLPEAAHLPNSVHADFRFGLPAVMSLSLGPTASCKGCGMALLPAWEDRGGRGRYHSLSRSGGLLSA